MAASLDSAVESVRRLESLALPDEQPNIEACPTSVVYDTSFDTNFEDRNAFVTGIAKFMEEATVHSQLNKVLEEGAMYASMLYTWRSSSRAVPSVKSNEQPNRIEIYEKTVEVLKPEVDKLKSFMHFVESAIGTFTSEVKSLAHENKRKDFISETYLLTLSKLIDMFAILDALKNMKACLNNDLAFYKRADGFLKRGATVDAAAMQEFQFLSLFLATNNKITLKLKESLESIPGYEEVLAECVNLCCYLFENRKYLLPKEKHMLLKVIGFSLFLMDGVNSNIYKLDSRKKISLQRIDKIFKQVPVVPLFGDMQIALVSYIKQSPHYDSSKWSCVTDHAEEKAIAQHYSIQTKIDTIRAEHLRYISELARYNNEITTSGSTTWTDLQVRELTDLALRGLQLISGWTTQIVELYAWKLLHPTDRYTNRECPDDAEEYERATRYNYSSAEKFALVEVIAMVKGLTVLLTRLEVTFIEAISRHVHMVLQVFVQKGLRDQIRHSIKKKKQQLKIVLFAIRDTCVDWTNGREPSDDPCLRGEKDPKGGFHIQLSHRSVAPSATQLYMCRTMVESLISEKTGKKGLRNDLDLKMLPEMEEFHKKTFFFPLLINFGRTLQEASDLSQLWYREFFLELTMGKRIQFPIEMSMPWILTDHILETKEASMMEYLLYPLDLYSDAGHYALHRFRKQYLYDEVEAEVNLCFDQFIYKLSEQIFIYYKSLACSILLDKRFRSELETVRIPFPAANRYHTILKQRHVQILGRSIDLNRLITQRLLVHMLRALDMAISRFESSDLTGIIELEHLLETNALTHQMLSEYIALDPFDALLREANQSVNLPHGRITLHCFLEINTDFMPNWCYNSTTNRFVRTTLPLTEAISREAPPKGPQYYFYGTRAINNAFAAIHQLQQGFLGHGHFSAMSRLLGYQGIAMIIEELLKQTHLCITNTLQPYVTALMEGMPKRCRQPLSDYGASGVLDFYYAQLESIVQYRSLRTDVFQSFKEIGNAILFCLIVEQCLSQEEVLDLLQAAPFQGVLPRPYVKDGITQEQAIQELQEQYASLQLVQTITQLGTPMQANTAKDCDLLTKERLCRGLSMFEVVLKKIRSFLVGGDPKVTQLWVGPPPLNGVMHVDECLEFHRLWSALQFVICMPLGPNIVSPEEAFGDGLQWAGIAFIYLLGQTKRFEALDFAYHILKIYVPGKSDGPSETGINVRRMAERTRAVQNLNNHILSIIQKHLVSPSDAQEDVKYFPPPIYQSAMSAV